MEHLKQDSRLGDVVVNQTLLDALYAQGLMSKEAREEVMQEIFPKHQWGMWVSRLLLFLAVTLILAGVIYFFAFNWTKIPPLVKLFSIQIMMVFCLFGAYIKKLDALVGQLFLLSASVLVGVFMAVFGQVYQTGADAYQLFMMWSLLTFGWTLIARSPAQWAFWLLITNIFIILWCEQVMSSSYGENDWVFTFLILFNGLALAVREYFVLKTMRLETKDEADHTSMVNHKHFNVAWFKEKYSQAYWLRAVLVIVLLWCMTVPVMVLIINFSDNNNSATVTATLLAMFGYAAMFHWYRYIFKDIFALSVWVLSMCYISEILVWKVLTLFMDDLEAFLYFSLFTIGIFSMAVKYLIEWSKEMGAEHG